LACLLSLLLAGCRVHEDAVGGGAKALDRLGEGNRFPGQFELAGVETLRQEVSLAHVLPFAERDALARAWLAPAPLDLRVNTLKANREKMLPRLSHLGAEPTPWSPIARLTAWRIVNVGAVTPWVTVPPRSKP
jgi:hypothetical protein